MLFMQSSREALADRQLLQRLVNQVGARATLRVVQDADHSFHVPARARRMDADVRAEMLNALAEWIEMAVNRRVAVGR